MRIQDMYPDTTWIYGPMDTPLGALYLLGNERGLRWVLWAVQLPERNPSPSPPLQMAQTWGAQIEAYFRGECPAMDGPIDLQWASLFTKQVLTYLRTIPYGETRTYRQIAVALGRPSAARAVGRVLARNPMPIVLPCHRVVARDGRLHGYSGPGGLRTKAWLLQWERQHCRS